MADEETEDCEGWTISGTGTAELYDLTEHDGDTAIPNDPLHPESLSTNPAVEHNQVTPALATAPFSAAPGLSPFGAMIQALDLEMDLDEHGWGADVDEENLEDPLELALDEDLPAAWMGDDGYIESDWLMDQSAFESTLATMGLVNERLALQQGEERDLLEQLIKHHQLTLGVRQRAFHLQQLRISVQAACTTLPLQKRLRGDLASLNSQRLNDVISVNSAGLARSADSGKSWDFGTTQMPPKGRRRQAFLMQHYPGTSRADLEARQRASLIDQVLAILTKAGAPIIEASTESNFPKATVEGSVGATRPGTMVTYIRAFRTFLEYLFICTGLQWPTKFTHVTDYLHMKGNEPCSASTPQVFLQSLAWFEKTAGIPSGEHFAKHDVVKRTVDAVTEKVAVGNPPLKQAPRMPAVMIASTELFVCDTARPLGLRMKAFAQLLKVYCTLREDDLQHLGPRRLRVAGELLIAELLRTKTTGRTKRIKELPLVLWVGSSITGSSWLENGLAEIENFGDNERDFFLPRISADFNEALPGPCTYAASSALSRRLAQELRQPIFKDGAWKQSENLLLHPLLCGFWSEHSPRSVLPSLLAVLDEDKVRIDYLGKWSPSGSQDYTRTFRSVVRSLQEKAVRAIRSADPRLDDYDILDRLSRFCSEHDFNSEVTEQVVNHLRSILDSFVTILRSPECKAWASTASDLETAFNQTASAPAPIVCFKRKPTQDQRQGRFLIVFSNNRNFARLHRIEGSNCPWVKTQIKDCMETDSINPSMYNARCKLCWPETSPDEEQSVSSHSE